MTFRGSREGALLCFRTEQALQECSLINDLIVNKYIPSSVEGKIDDANGRDVV